MQEKGWTAKKIASFRERKGVKTRPWTGKVWDSTTILLAYEERLEGVKWESNEFTGRKVKLVGKSLSGCGFQLEHSFHIGMTNNDEQRIDCSLMQVVVKTSFPYLNGLKMRKVLHIFTCLIFLIWN